MRQTVRLACVGWFLLTLLSASQVESQQKERAPQIRKVPSPAGAAPMKAQPLPADEALTLLKQLEEKGTLVLAVTGEMGRRMGLRYTGTLTRENCFGWRLAGGERVVAKAPEDS